MSGKPSSLSVLKWIRLQRTNAQAYEAQAWQLLQKSIEVKIALGDLYSVKCIDCGSVIPWPGMGKRPLRCPICRDNKRKHYLKSWRQNNQDHQRTYMRLYRQRCRKHVPLTTGP